MSIESILEASRVGLDHERLRMDIASRNIAAANVPLAPGDVAARAQAADFGRQLLPGQGELARAAPATRQVHDPGHPMADAEGRVHYPDTDLVQEMTTLMTASRGYEANVRAFNLLRGMVLRALEIGAK
jgi:flagellar basal-body rod protein FlgC